MNQVIQGDCLEVMRGMADESVHCCVTSPPYFGLRDYGCDGQLGLEKTPEEYVSRMVEVFRDVRRVLRDDGTLWLNLGDSYAGYHGNKNSVVPTSAVNGWTNGTNENTRGDRKPQDIGLKTKDLIGIPWHVAFALQADGWYLRQDIIWHKPNPMPESVRDRCTKAHEYIFLLSKSPRYFYDADAIREPHITFSEKSKMSGGRNHFGIRNGTPEKGKNAGNNNCHDGRRDQAFHPIGRNRRSVWTVSTQPYKGAHFATFPQRLIEPCILAGCPVGGTVLDPFFGSGTTGAVAVEHGRQYLGIELNPEYIALAQKRIGEAIKKAPLSLEQRVAWLETQALGAKVKRLEASQQLSLWETS